MIRRSRDADRPRRLHEVLLAQRQEQAADEAGDAHPAEEPEDERRSASTLPLPKKRLATRMTNRSGRVSMTSTTRIRRLSAKPPTNPAIVPTIVPMMTPMIMLEKPMNSDVRAPLTTSIRTSRWRPPVSPNGCCQRTAPRPW